MELVLKNDAIRHSLGDKVTAINMEDAKKIINDEGCPAYSYSFILRGTRGQV